ncbi:hypothetical protein P8C59_000598 [Phyllachora maydis]|uniref:Uncharacterized protein n=1 Tax=Phyllachora maydis TaxID=1825666 RepID=A0AAD9HWF5_9PEZI|nr:hypothetical protein P8C59_000598 [Phyllachora maydis]
MPIPVPIAAKVGIIAVSVAVAAAIAAYESPEIRRMAEDLRRRIAIALHSLGDNVDPSRRVNPLFNRPEDADGFLQSRGGGEHGVEADEASRRRQREELMHWNAVLEEKRQREQNEAEKMAGTLTNRSGQSFDHFLQQDSAAEKGTFVYNTGAQVRPGDEGLVRRRGVEGVKGLSAAVYANPFADENGIDFDEHPGMETEEDPLQPGRDEVMSDIYNASPRLTNVEPAPVSQGVPPPPAAEVLFDYKEAQEPGRPARAVELVPESTTSTATLDRDVVGEDYTTAGQEDRDEAYASIQAWAQNSSNPSFYSPLPVSPPAPLSEPEIISEGHSTPTECVSVAGSGEDLGAHAASSKAGTNSDYDVMSVDESGVATPTSWSEVGSRVSESEGHGNA